MTKILYIANIRLPTERAHGVQIMEMCSALAEAGADVELCVPRRRNAITLDPFVYYHLPQNPKFKVTQLATWDLVHRGKLGFWIQSLTFAIAALWYARNANAHIYSRDEMPLFLLSFFKKTFSYEPHAPLWNNVTTRVAESAHLLFPISLGLKEFYQHAGVPEEKMFIARDGVNLSRFTVSESKEACREKLQLPPHAKIVLYSGHLYARKGAQIFADAAAQLDMNTLCIFVGGTKEDIADFREKYGTQKNMIILGHKPHDEIPYYLSAADVLVLPNSAKNEDARLYTSPMKLFEYMASGTPVVASDVPSLREVLTEENALLVTADEPKAFTHGIELLLSDEVLAGKLAARAKEDVKMYAWQKRAEAVLKQIQKTNS